MSTQKIMDSLPTVVGKLDGLCLPRHLASLVRKHHRDMKYWEGEANKATNPEQPARGLPPRQADHASASRANRKADSAYFALEAAAAALYHQTVKNREAVMSSQLYESGEDGAYASSPIGVEQDFWIKSIVHADIWPSTWMSPDGVAPPDTVIPQYAEDELQGVIDSYARKEVIRSILAVADTGYLGINPLQEGDRFMSLSASPPLVHAAIGGWKAVVAYAATAFNGKYLPYVGGELITGRSFSAAVRSIERTAADEKLEAAIDDAVESSFDDAAAAAATAKLLSGLARILAVKPMTYEELIEFLITPKGALFQPLLLEDEAVLRSLVK